MKGSEENGCLIASFASPSWEKQKEVMDSMRYTQRIQTAQLPSEKKIMKSLQRLKKT
jgi:hypothetical protein